MPCTLTWICHASTAASRTAAFPGDEPLDPFGERDCGKARLPSTADRAWAAPELRAQQTAERLGITASVEPALRDCDYGRWAERAFEDIAHAEPGGLQAWLEDPNATPHDGESMRALLARIAGWMEQRRSDDGRAFAVAHPNVVRMAVVHALGAGPEVARNLDIAPLGFAVTAWNGRWRLRTLGSLLD